MPARRTAVAAPVVLGGLLGAVLLGLSPHGAAAATPAPTPTPTPTPTVSSGIGTPLGPEGPTGPDVQVPGATPHGQVLSLVSGSSQNVQTPTTGAGSSTVLAIVLIAGGGAAAGASTLQGRSRR